MGHDVEIYRYTEFPELMGRARAFFTNHKGPEMIQNDETVHAYMTMPDLDDGKLFFLATKKDNPEETLATLGVVLAALSWKDEVYLTGAALLDTPDSIEAFKCLVEHGEKLASQIRPQLKMRLGIGPRLEFAIPYVESWGYHLMDHMCHLEYRAPRTSATSMLHMQPITSETAEAYVQIHDICFESVPNSAKASLAEVMGSLADEGVWRGFFEDGTGGVIGFYELTTKGGDGWIEAIGILPDHRGCGYAKEVLNTCRQHFLEQGISKMGLLVMDSNTKAYSTYLNYGFTHMSTYNNWFQKEV